MATEADLLEQKEEFETQILILQEQNVYLELTPEQIAAYITLHHPNKEQQRENESEMTIAREELHKVLEELRTEHNWPG